MVDLWPQARRRPRLCHALHRRDAQVEARRGGAAQGLSAARRAARPSLQDRAVRRRAHHHVPLDPRAVGGRSSRPISAPCCIPAIGSSTRTPLTSPPTDTARLKALGEEGVTALICDSTNAIRDGVSASEADVAVALERLIAEAPKRVAVTTFASNVARIRSVANAARAAGRKLVVVGRAMYRVIEAAQETGYLDPDLPIHEETRIREDPAAQGRGAVHRQPGRGARRHGAHRARRAPQCRARRRRPRDLLLAHHPGQREGGRARAERPCRSRRRGDHRQRRAGACVGPSAPRRARAALSLGEAEDRHPDAWRGAASRGPCAGSPRQLGVPRGHPRAERRHGAARARRPPRSSTMCRSAASTATAPSSPAPTTGRCASGAS